MLIRFMGAFGFCVGGIELVRLGMQLNGSASRMNPVWWFVSGIHNVIATCAYFIAVGTLIFATLFIVLEIISRLMPTQPCLPQDAVPEHIAESRRKADEARLNMEEQRKFEEEQQRQAAIERQKRLEEERLKMSADEVTRSTLRDFL